MRRFPLVLLLLVAPSLVASQQSDLPAQPSPPGPRKVTATVGIGNAMGWLGGQAESYFAHQRASVFAGLGYTPEFDPGDPTGFTFALGVRGFTPGQKHRGFLELSLSLIAIRQGFLDDGDRYYGPGLQAGYQFVSRGGFTLMGSLGAGYAPGAPDGESKVYELAGLGLGYTWRARAPTGH